MVRCSAISDCCCLDKLREDNRQNYLDVCDETRFQTAVVWAQWLLWNPLLLSEDYMMKSGYGSKKADISDLMRTNECSLCFHLQHFLWCSQCAHEEINQHEHDSAVDYSWIFNRQKCLFLSKRAFYAEYYRIVTGWSLCFTPFLLETCYNTVACYWGPLVNISVTVKY